MTSPTVVVCGPASWNHLILLDRLPEPVPHMQFAQRSLHTVGGTSAGKALHLAGLGVPTRLHALLGDDDDGRRVAGALRGAGLDLVAHASAETERHVNLMTADGARVSLYVSTPSSPAADDVQVIEASLRAADVAVVDLSAVGADVIGRLGDARAGGRRPDVWTDLHDYDGASPFHEPFLRAAQVVFMNADATDDSWALLASCVARGPRLAVCTLGAAGAIALDDAGRRFEVAAAPADVVDTNGAGDAFFAGVLAATLAGARAGAGAGARARADVAAARADVAAALAAGAAQAAVALSSPHLHPNLAEKPLPA